MKPTLSAEEIDQIWSEAVGTKNGGMLVMHLNNNGDKNYRWDAKEADPWIESSFKP